MKNKLLSTFDLEQYLRTFKGFHGEWVTKPSGYESFFAEEIGAQLSKDRFKDCIWNGLCIELKKSREGGHPWLDLRRYSLYIQESSNEPVITLFLFYNKLSKRIVRIYGVSTKQLLEVLKINDYTANLVLELDNSVAKKYPLNVQSMLTDTDIKNIADFAITY
ncbi:MAG: hypothetical protein PXY39_04680 [archaeon]|nr:hypothetical protein [archaeon]